MLSDQSVDRAGSPQSSETRDRAVSEVLGYVLIFTLIVGSIAIVTVGGLSSLENARTNEQAVNAERAFDVLHDNLQDVHSEGAPSRATEIALGDSQLYFGDNVTMRVKVASESDPFEYEDIRPVIFRIGDGRQLVYEGGATFRESRDGGIMLNDPPFRLVDDTGPGPSRAYLPIVRTTAPSVQSVGSTNVLVRGQAGAREVRHQATGGATLEYVEIVSPRYEIWAQYFSDAGYCDDPPDVDDAAQRVTCNVHDDYDDPDQLYVTHQQIVLELID